LGTETLKKKLQLSYKLPRLIPGKCPDEEVQRKALQDIEHLMERAEKREIHLFFGDPTHKIHNTVLGECWQEKGKTGTYILPSNTGRKRVTILGFYNPLSHDLVSLVTEGNADKQSLEKAYEELRKSYSDEKEIIVIQDNARYNHAYSVSDHAKQLRITPYFLPPYCPNLNLIERLWRLMKKTIMKNIFYPTFNDFWSAIISFCSSPEKYINELKSIMSQKFEIIKAA